MLYPQSNASRSQLQCEGFWKFKVDPQKVGEEEEWYRGFDSDVEIAVPGSWNEQFEEIGLSNYIGAAWYCNTVFVPQDWHGRRIWIRIGSADYDAAIWLNGTYVGQHQGGFLPFEFEISSAVVLGEKNVLTIRVSNELSSETIPQGISSEDFVREGRLREETFPPARFDFFPYGGIHRPVLVHATPQHYLESIFIDTNLQSTTTGGVRIRVAARCEGSMSVRCTIDGEHDLGETVSPVHEGFAVVTLTIKGCRFWSPRDPHLYLLHVELLTGEDVVDEYEMKIGVRQVSIVKGKLLLNGKPIYLKGFGRHEDFPVLGKAVSSPLVVKDFGLMKWINANSFRTSHYPYSEEMMSMADRKGFLVIDEVPAVSLDLRRANEKTLTAHRQAIKELIERDYNHPSVIVWALGNEPNLVGDEAYQQGSGARYWEKIFAFARSLDSTRPMTVPNCTRVGVTDPVFEFSDILAINRYYGWYEFPGRIEHGITVMEREMDILHSKYSKPVLVTEFGADTIPGLHSISDQMFTEEYQEEFLERYIKLLRSKEYVIGEHVWNFADFKTPQHFRRVLMNMKGIFTRTRQPKAAAFKLKKLWNNAEHEK